MPLSLSPSQTWSYAFKFSDTHYVSQEPKEKDRSLLRKATSLGQGGLLSDGVVHARSRRCWQGTYLSYASIVSVEPRRVRQLSSHGTGTT